MIKNRITLEEYKQSKFLFETILINKYGSTDKYLSYDMEKRTDDTFRIYKFPKKEWTMPGGYAPLFEYVIFKFHDYVPLFSKGNKVETKCYVYMFNSNELDRFINIERYFVDNEEKLK